MKSIYIFILYACNIAAGSSKELAYERAEESWDYLKIRLSKETEELPHYPKGRSYLDNYGNF